MPEGSEINAMFGKIARRYDLANTLLSGGACHWWTRRLARRAGAFLGGKGVVADLATGSGDVAFALAAAAPDATVRGFDFCEPMLDVARSRLAQKDSALGGRVSFAFGDCMALPLDDASVDAVTVAYGVRNFQDRARGLAEIFRVLRPGGAVFVLEFTQPRAWFRPFYTFYLRRILPWLARVATGNKDAYDYLAGSILNFPAADAFSQELRSVGFSAVNADLLTFGVVALHRAVK
jgi:demethylmenaquinone methyltransferase/2-methoxy-6-polyprenyl-1,4-benzoquinol methylase